MIGQELIILFKEDKAYLVVDTPLTFDEVEIGDWAKSRGFKSPAFWKVKVLRYDPIRGQINVDVLSYKTGDTDFSPSQENIADELRTIKKVVFKSISTNGLLFTLAGGQAGKNYSKEEDTIDQTEGQYSQTNNYHQQYKSEPVRSVIKERFYIQLKNVRFKLGGVSFDKKLKGLNKTIELTIQNYDIREEFDAIKNYFANVLKTKKIEVTVSLETTDGEITSIEVTSPEITKINKELIDNVKFEFVKTITKKKILVEIDKTLFTMDEYFDTFADEKFKSNTFYSDDKQLLEDLLHISNTKHYKHLRFLSSKHAHEAMKLRFVHKPFSFIFLIEGDRHNHIIWETLDTAEATYVWHIDKRPETLKLTLRKIEDIINVIKVQGKTAYLNSNEDPFRRIYHDYSDLVEGFVKWKGELESVLT